MSTCGVYKITNSVNGKFYIGSSKDIGGRWRQHRSDLHKGKHHNIHLQRAWDKYGEGLFRFDILCECEEDELLPEEQELIDKFCNDKDRSYNISLIAGRGMTSKESRLKLSRCKTGKKLSLETRKKLSEINKGSKNPNWGLKRTPETKRKMSLSARGKTHSVATRVKISINRTGKMTGIDHPLYGKERTEETKAKISIANKGKMVGDKNPSWGIKGIASPSYGAKSSVARKVIQLNIDGTKIREYSCIADAERETRISSSHIVAVCRGKRKTSGGFQWKYTD